MFISFCFGSHSKGLCSTSTAACSSDRSSKLTRNFHAYSELLRTRFHSLGENEHLLSGEILGTLQPSHQVGREPLRNRTALASAVFEQYFSSDNTTLLQKYARVSHFYQLPFPFFQLDIQFALLITHIVKGRNLHLWDNLNDTFESLYRGIKIFCSQYSSNIYMYLSHTRSNSLNTCIVPYPLTKPLYNSLQ